MPHSNPAEVVEDFIDDYENDWNITLSYEDAVFMISLYDGLSVLFEKYVGNDGRSVRRPYFMQR